MSAIDSRIEEEFEGGNWIVALDGPVIEVFHGPTARSNRRHVKHADISFVSRRGGEVMVIQSKQLRGIADPERNHIDIVAEDKDRINSLVRAAIARGATDAGPQAG